LKNDDFGRTELLLIWKRRTTIDAAPEEEPRSIPFLKEEAAQQRQLEAEPGSDDAPDDRKLQNWRSGAGSGQMLQRLEMSPEQIEWATEGFLRLATRLKRSGSKHLQIEGKIEAELLSLTLQDAKQQRSAEFQTIMTVDEPFEEEPKLSEEKKIEDQNFEVKPLPKLFEDDKRKKILQRRNRSGEFREDEPRTPADLKAAQRSDDQTIGIRYPMKN
jgi:hypothetical protein